MSFLNNSPFGSANQVDVVEALSGATIPTATVAPLDEVLIQDVDDSENLKTVTAQSVADLFVPPVTSVDGLTGAVVLPRASQGEAETGTENTKIMTALRVAQAIAAHPSTIQNNLTAIVAPGVNDDTLAGYQVGSFWIDTVLNESYRCVDATAGAAVWVNTSLESTELATVALSGNSDDLTEGTTNLLLTSAERTKLAGIEAGATADQTDAEIKTAYENNANTNAFTDADVTKLGTIETNADVTDEGNVIPALDGAIITPTTVASGDKVLVQDVSDADNLKTVTAQSIADLAAGGAVTSVNTQTGAVVLDADDISDAATINKYTTSAEISKLAGIEANATADQTDLEIKTAYENNVNTNAFTDAEQTKLTGIAAGAQVNTVDSVNTQTGAVVLDADNIADAATTNKFTTVAEINKLAAIEALADVTDEANVTAALDGATLTAVTVAGTDKVLVQDASDLDNLKSVTAQSIADLGGGAGGGKVLQVVNANVSHPTTGASTSTTYATFLSASITPSNIANKILIIGDFDGFVGGAGGGVGTRVGINIERGTTQIREKAALCEAWDSVIQRACNGSIQYLDSPSTTASTTYNLGYNRSLGTGTAFFNGTTGMSCGLTLIEIDGT